jgi:TonB family protein
VRRTGFLSLIVLAALGCNDKPRRAAEKVPRAEPPVERRPEPQAEYPKFRYPSRPEPGDPLRNPRVPARVIERVEPEYTEEARKARVFGIVILELVIEPDGRVSGGRVLKPLPMGLTQRAIDAVGKWRFEPALDGGKPVRAIHTVTVNFAPK